MTHHYLEAWFMSFLCSRNLKSGGYWIINLQSEKIDEEEDRPGQKNSWRRQIKSKKQLEKTDQVKKTVGEDR